MNSLYLSLFHRQMMLGTIWTFLSNLLTGEWTNPPPPNWLGRLFYRDDVPSERVYVYRSLIRIAVQTQDYSLFLYTITRYLNLSNPDGRIIRIPIHWSV